MPAEVTEGKERGEVKALMGYDMSCVQLIVSLVWSLYRNQMVWSLCLTDYAVSYNIMSNLSQG